MTETNRIEYKRFRINKELMRIFKDLDLVEQLGSGIPRILQSYGKECFRFTDNFLRMSFPSTEEVNLDISKSNQDTEQDTEQDNNTNNQSFEELTEQDSNQVTEQVDDLILKMSQKEYSRAEMMKLVAIKHRPTFLYNYLQLAIKSGMIEMTIPDKPNSKNQKYRLTNKGINRQGLIYHILFKRK